MTEGERQAFRTAFCRKKDSEMTPEERELFDKEFQYGLSNDPNAEPTAKKSQPLPKPKDLTIGFLGRLNF